MGLIETPAWICLPLVAHSASASRQQGLDIAAATLQIVTIDTGTSAPDHAIDY
jgi:hypothetical protein